MSLLSFLVPMPFVPVDMISPVCCILYAFGAFMYTCFQESPDEGGWHDLVAKGFIEYIDTEEEETTMISMTINVSNKQA